MTLLKTIGAECVTRSSTSSPSWPVTMIMSAGSAINSSAPLRASAGITARPSDFNPHIVAVDPAQLMQDFQEYRDTCLLVRHACGTHEQADPPQLLALLRTHRERPRAG